MVSRETVMRAARGAPERPARRRPADREAGMDIEFKRNLIKLLSGLIWASVPLFALLLLLPHPAAEGYELRPALLLLMVVLVLNMAVSLLPMRRALLLRYNQLFFFLIGVGFATTACFLMSYTGGARSPLFPFMLLVVCFGTTFYASMVTPLALMAMLSAGYVLCMHWFTDLGSADFQLLASQVLFLFLATLFVNRLGHDTRQQVRARNEALRELKLLSEMDRATSNFVSAVSFEMRTPLTSIQGFSEMLLQQDLEQEKEREFVDIISKEAEHLADLVEELLDISRLESGRAKLKREEVDVYWLLRRCSNTLEGVCGPTDLVLDLPEELPSLYLDRVRMDRVFKAVFHQVKRNCSDGAEVRVGAKSEDDSLVITINYRSKRDREAAEEPAEELWTEELEGREEDLDMAIARRIVVAHGGSVNAVKAPGRWSTYVFRLPVMGLEEFVAEEKELGI